MPLLAPLETSCLASKFSSSTCSLFNFAPSSRDYCCTKPESQLCFNFQNPVHVTWARLQTANTCRTSGTTNDHLKSLKALLNIKTPLLIYTTPATAEKYLKETCILHFCGNLETHSKQLIEKSYSKML